MGSTGTPPKGPERLVLRHLQAPDAPQQQQQQQQHASYSQVGAPVVSVSSSSSGMPAHLQQHVAALQCL